MKCRQFAITVLASLIVAGPAPALFAQDATWFEASSEHFILFTDTSEEKAHRLVADLEGRVAVFSAAFGALPPRQFPIEVFLFRQERDFTEAAPRLARRPAAPAAQGFPSLSAPPRDTLNKSAYLIRGADRIFVIARDRSPQDIANDVGHALGHALFERYVVWRPFWLAEAAAEYFRKAGRNPDTGRIRERDAYTVADLLSIVPSGAYDDNEDGGEFRRQSHRLFRLILDEDPQIVRDFLQVLRTENGERAAPEIEPEALEERLESYVETRVDLTPLTAAATVTEADSARLAIHRGDLLLATERTFEAARWYNGDSNTARAARAIHARFSRAAGEASRILANAARDLPGMGLVQFHFGAMNLEGESELQAQALALERAVQLLPLYGGAQAELARVYAATGRADEAEALLAKALQLEPESADRIYQIRAETLLALGQFNEAFRVMDLAVSLPHVDRAADERFVVARLEFRRKIENARRDADNRRLEEIRREVEAQAREQDPRPEPAPPEPPAPAGAVNYQIEARFRIDVIHAAYPVYPEAMRRAGSAGAIALRVDVAADGTVANAAVTSSELPELNDATVDAVKQWTFSPAAGAGSTRTLRLVFNYSLQ